MRNTGEFAPTGLAARDVHVISTNTSRSRQPRQLLTNEGKELTFELHFANGEIVRIGVIGSGEEPTAFWKVMSAFKRLAKLTPNWDSYKAQPLSPVAVRRSFDLLTTLLRDDVPEPTVIPTSEGGLQFEWHRQGVDVEVHVPPSGPTAYLIVDEDAGTEKESQGIDRAAILAAFGRMTR